MLNDAPIMQSSAIADDSSLNQKHPIKVDLKFVDSIKTIILLFRHCVIYRVYLSVLLDVT